MKMQKMILLMALALSTQIAYAQDVARLLKAADQYRIPHENVQVETQITIFNRDGSQDKERRYLVFSQADRKSLVLMQSPAEKGQKMLMLGDDFWMMLPGSQRPIRITPLQKLLGEASIGDVATASWASDYKGSLIGEELCDDKACLRLSLNAVRAGIAYQHIDLWIGKAHNEPIKADFYVLSGKMAKQARFVLDKASRPTMVVEMILQDQLGSQKETRMRYLTRKEKIMPEQWLNPMYLAKNPVLE
jgi:hypothetical protein